MIKLDLHIHSQYSEDAIGSPKDIIKSLKKKGLQGMAITDHNTVEGGLKAVKIAPKDFIVIPGIEISTADGHMLALNVEKNIARNLSIPCWPYNHQIASVLSPARCFRSPRFK